MVSNPVPGMNQKQLKEVYINRKGQGLEKCTLKEYLTKFKRSKQ